jgi:hypothetical protein
VCVCVRGGARGEVRLEGARPSPARRSAQQAAVSSSAAHTPLSALPHCPLSPQAPPWQRTRSTGGGSAAAGRGGSSTSQRTRLPIPGICSSTH